MQKASGKKNQKHFNPAIGLLFLALFALAVGCYLIVFIRQSESLNASLTLSAPPAQIQTSEAKPAVDDDSLAQFASENDFKKYLTDSGSLLGGQPPYWQPAPAAQDSQADKIKAAPASGGQANLPASLASQPGSASGSINSDWFSWTADELGGETPDIAKSDGSNIYLSPDDQYFLAKTKTVDTSTFSARQITTGKTKIISALPPKGISNLGSVDGHGSVLVSQNVLAVFSANQILGYSVGDSSNFAQIWKVRLDDNSQLAAARLYSDVLYLVLRSAIDSANPCPLRPIVDGDNPLLVRCEDIYHPAQNSYVDSTFTALVLDLKTGIARQTFSFVGSAQKTVIYLSPNFLYATWGFDGDIGKFFSGFLASQGDLVPDFVREEISKLKDYDISSQSKTDQIGFVLQSYAQSLDASSRTAFQNDLASRLSRYAADNSRDLDITAIAKIRLSDFRVEAVGSLPGHPLDQYSLNESGGMLRVATTVGQVDGFGVIDQGAAATDDIYILDNGLQTVGSALGLGYGQQIESARFADDVGYLVTARDTDPIYLLDLSDVSNPKIAGQIDLAGTSSYVYELSKTKIAIVSKDKYKTKLSLFDVSLASDPKLLDKYSLDEYWADSDDSHGAFWQDPANQLIVVVAGKTAYAFSYADDKLTLKKIISGVTAARAFPIGNYIYLVGNDRIVVVDGSTLEKVSRLDVK